MPAEWEPQSMVQLTWPHKDTDWAPILPEITAVYEEMAREILKRESLLVVAPEDILPNILSSSCVPSVASVLRPSGPLPHMTCHFTSNDTWARDHGFITVE